jgi:hypothetical protein
MPPVRQTERVTMGVLVCLTRALHKRRGGPAARRKRGEDGYDDEDYHDDDDDYEESRKLGFYEGDGRRREAYQGDGRRREAYQGDGRRREAYQGDGRRREADQGDGSLKTPNVYKCTIVMGRIFLHIKRRCTCMLNRQYVCMSMSSLVYSTLN